MAKAWDDAKTDTPTDVQVSVKGAKRQTQKNLTLKSSKPGKKPAPTSKPSKANNTWQQYVKNKFSNASWAEAVAQVMQQQEKKVVEIATIIDSIFY